MMDQALSDVTVARFSTPEGMAFRLMEQSHCAKCWNPLLVPLGWPGPRRGLTSPWMDPKNMSLQVTQCGHVYHVACVAGEDHCAACRAYITRQGPLQVVVKSYDSRKVDTTEKTCTPLSSTTNLLSDKEEPSPTARLSGDSSVAEDKDIAEKSPKARIKELRTRLDGITSDISKLKKEYGATP